MELSVSPTEDALSEYTSIMQFIVKKTKKKLKEGSFPVNLQFHQHCVPPPPKLNREYILLPVGVGYPDRL